MYILQIEKTQGNSSLMGLGNDCVIKNHFSVIYFYVRFVILMLCILPSYCH